MSELIEEASEVNDIQVEISFVGCVYKKPDILVDYGHYIRSQYDFQDEATRFMFDNAFTMFQTRTQELNKSNVIVFMSEEPERLSKFKKFGGWKILEEWMSLGNENDVKNYFDTIKKYSLLREYERNGFNIETIKNNRRFSTFTASDIYKLIRGKADKIHTVILGDSEVEVLNSNVSSMVDECLELPDMGFEIPFPILNEVFQGMQLSTMMAVAAMSNAGKSRLMIKLIAYATFVLKQKTFVMVNEMTVQKMRKALLTTVINNPEYIPLHGVKIHKPEREIVLGLYRDDLTGDFIGRYKDENGNFTETLEEFKARVEDNSEEYRLVKKVAKWVEDESNNKLLIKDVSTDYSDQSLEFEIKKAVLTKGVKLWFYDTCKNEQTGEWSAFKITCTKLSEICKQLNVFGYLSIQLNDETNAVAPESMNSSCIAEAKQIKHILDSLILIKEIPSCYFYRYAYYPSHSSIGTPMSMPLESGKRYYCFVVDKNRSGDKPKLIFELDLNLNTWIEKGTLLVSNSKR